VPAPERAVWLDFRYGRTYAADSLNPHSDSILDALPARARADVDRVGAAVAQELQQRFPAPVLFAVDGVLDAHGQAWWLEVNSNPTLPPDGYARIFSTLFGPPRAEN
jgi:D-alanine-D-alanine ligase-like ATP-grasp enzyme